MRELIFRELVANIIIHREYNSATPTQVIIYEDRVEATNPNRRRFTGPLNLETFEAEPKNPNIRAFFNILTWADEIGSGVRNMNKFVDNYTGGGHPMFIEDEPFKSTIPMILYKLGTKSELYLHLAQLTKKQLGPYKVNALQELPLDLRFKNVGDLDELALQLVQSWAEKSGELLKKRARVLLGTLILTLSPISIDELASLLGYRSKERYRDDYIKPLKNNRLVEYTLERANSPNQQYVITSRGKLFLGGSLI